MFRKKIKLDDDGFLADCEDWNEEVAKKVASLEGVAPLTEEKMEIIRFMRIHFVSVDGGKHFLLEECC